MTEATPATRTPWSIPPEARTEWLRLAEVLAVEGPAPCEEGDPEAWWPAGRGSPEAVAGCEVCPARAECLTYALAADEREGLWGGLMPDERRAMRRTAA